jgi:hypothetical protein
VTAEAGYTDRCEGSASARQAQRYHWAEAQMGFTSIPEVGRSMTDARAISATFATWRPVNGRKVLQLVFEVPIEQQGEVLTMLGAPDDKWCAIALLKKKPETVAEALAAKPKTAFKDMALPAQCGIRCEDVQFQEFIKSCHGVASALYVTGFVRMYCDVKSRAELSTNHEAPLPNLARQAQARSQSGTFWITGSS